MWGRCNDWESNRHKWPKGRGRPLAFAVAKDSFCGRRKIHNSKRLYGWNIVLGKAHIWNIPLITISVYPIVKTQLLFVLVIFAPFESGDCGLSNCVSSFRVPRAGWVAATAANHPAHRESRELQLESKEFRREVHRSPGSTTEPLVPMKDRRKVVVLLSNPIYVFLGGLNPMRILSVAMGFRCSITWIHVM